MSQSSFFDLIIMVVASAPGTGDITLGAPAVPYLGFSNYPTTIPDGTKVSYSIADGLDNTECGTATYRTPAASSTTYGKLENRSNIISTASSSAAINASGDAIVQCTLRAEDMTNFDASAIVTGTIAAARLPLAIPLNSNNIMPRMATTPIREHPQAQEGLSSLLPTSPISRRRCMVL